MDNTAKLRPLYLAKILYEKTDEDKNFTGGRKNYLSLIKRTLALI